MKYNNPFSGPLAGCLLLIQPCSMPWPHTTPGISARELLTLRKHNCCRQYNWNLWHDNAQCFKQQLGCRFDIMDNISYFFVFWHMQLYMSWYIRSFFGFTFLNILYFFKYSCTNIFHRRSLYTFYLCIIAKWCHIATSFWVSIGSGNGFFLDVTKPLHEPNFNHHQRFCGIHLRTTQTWFMGPTWGPPGSCQPQMGPVLAPWTLLLGNFTHELNPKYVFGDYTFEINSLAPGRS